MDSAQLPDASSGAGDVLVSIVVPVYNAGKFLSRCLDSILGQTHAALEVFLVDDGSTDDSLSICREYASRDGRISVVEQDNQGVSVARNAAIDASHGEWTCFVDSDDWLEPDAIERMLAATDADTDVLIADYFVDTVDDSWQDAFFSLDDHDFSEDERIELVKNCHLKTSFCKPDSQTMVGVPWAKLYRSRVLEEHGIRFDPRLRKMQDAIFNNEVFWNSSRILYRKIPVYHYRQNGASVAHKANASYERVAQAVLDAFGEFIARYGLEEELMPVYRARQFMFAFESVRFIYIVDDTGMGLGEKIRGVKRIMLGLGLREYESQFRPYLPGAYKIAFAFYKAHAYTLMYFAMVVYFKYKMRNKRLYT